jgi:DNA-binding Lrp family transcriptional regulator
MPKLKGIDFKILAELMKNSKTSDRTIAKNLGVSQPTITRRRARLEEDVIDSYTVIPKFKELGFELLAFNLLQYDPKVRTLPESQRIEKIRKTIKQHPSVIYASSGHGLKCQGVSVSIHPDYADYVAFIRATQEEWGEWVSNIHSFTVSLRSDNIIQPLTFRRLLKHIKE